MKQVFVADNPVQAHMVKDFLEGQGIAAAVRGENLFFVRGGLPLTEETLPSVWVEEVDFEDALKLLEKLREPPNLEIVD
jgi:hypothetical protein